MTTDFGPFTLTPSLIPILQKHFEDQEARKNYIYPDSEGNPTTGIGHLLATAEDAVKLPFQRPDGKTPATQPEINAVWQLVRSTMRPCRNIILPEPVIDRLFVQDLSRFAPLIYRNFGSIRNVPQPAVVGLYDIAFNVGGFLGFPRLRMAVLTEDWRMVAEESHRLKIGDRRNEATRNLFLAAAAAVKPPEIQKA